MNYAPRDDEFFSPLRDPLDRSKMRSLRPYQERAIAEIKQAIRDGHKRIMLQLPCGGGKTLLSAHIIAGALEKGHKALFTAPMVSLINQTITAFENEGLCHVGAIQAQHEQTDFYAPAQVASVQTLVRRRCPEFAVAMIDEAHLQWKAMNEMIDSPEWRDRIVIGLSATPWSRGLGLRYTKLIVAATTGELIDHGYLVPFHGYGPGLEADLKSVRTTAGDYNEGDLSGAMSRPELVADVVETWIKRGRGRPTFLFAVDRAHAAALQAQFEKAGVAAGYIDGYMESDERGEVLRMFRSGDYEVVCSVNCLATGVDEPYVSCAILARPTKSEMLHVQQIGRVLRTAPDKSDALLLDHAGNCERLGFPDAIHHDHLDTRKPGDRGGINIDDGEEKPAKKPRKCKTCDGLIHPGSKQCPHCGASCMRPSEIVSAEGELVEFGHSAKTMPKKESVKDRVAALGKQAVYSMLLGRAHELGKSSSWVKANYRDLFDVWPRGLSDVPASHMAPELASWLHSKRIAFTKSRERRLSNAR
jgi:DNA repair protein RadD